jgi:hypothetical protein
MNHPLTKLDEDGLTVIVDPEYTPDTPEQARQIINQLLSEKLQLREALIRAGWLIAAQTGCIAPPFPRPDNLCGCNGCSEMIEMPKIVQALSTPPPPVVRQEKYQADMDMMNQRLIDRTQGLLHTASRARLAPSAPSFRAGWEARSNWAWPDAGNLEQELQEHMNPEGTVGTQDR